MLETIPCFEGLGPLRRQIAERRKRIDENEAALGAVGFGGRRRGILRQRRHLALIGRRRTIWCVTAGHLTLEEQRRNLGRISYGVETSGEGFGKIEFARNDLFLQKQQRQHLQREAADAVIALGLADHEDAVPRLEDADERFGLRIAGVLGVEEVVALRGGEIV